MAWISFSDVWSKAKERVHLAAYAGLVGALVAVSAVAWWQGREKTACYANLAAINATGDAQASSSKVIGEQLEPIAEQDREANRKAVEGSQGGGCAISGDAFNRLRERQNSPTR